MDLTIGKLNFVSYMSYITGSVSIAFATVTHNEISFKGHDNSNESTLVWILLLYIRIISYSETVSNVENYCLLKYYRKKYRLMLLTSHTWLWIYFFIIQFYFYYCILSDFVSIICAGVRSIQTTQRNVSPDSGLRGPLSV